MRQYGIHHLDLRVSNYQRSSAFYNSLLRPLGFRTVGVKGEVVTYFVKGATALGIRPVKKRDTRNLSYSYKTAGIHHLAFSVENRSIVDGCYEQLSKRQVRIVHPPQEWPRYGRGYYSFFFLDPDGIMLEILHWGIQHPVTMSKYMDM